MWFDIYDKEQLIHNLSIITFFFKDNNKRGFKQLLSIYINGFISRSGDNGSTHVLQFPDSQMANTMR
jgi:hypothetical protein